MIYWDYIDEFGWWLIGGIPDTHAVLFRAEPVGGTLATQQGETIEVRYLPHDQIPEDLSSGYRERIEDAITGMGEAWRLNRRANAS
jgi:hypothetical protein